MQYKQEEALAGVGFVFIVGLASSPEDIVFGKHFASDDAGTMELKNAKVDCTKPLKKIGMYTSDDNRHI